MIKVKENVESGYWGVLLKATMMAETLLMECMDEKEALEAAQKLKIWKKSEVSEVLMEYLNSPYNLGSAVFTKTVTRYAELVTINGGKGTVTMVGVVTTTTENKYGRLGLTTNEAMALIGINSTIAGILSLVSMQERRELSTMMAAMLEAERTG